MIAAASNVSAMLIAAQNRLKGKILLNISILNIFNYHIYFINKCIKVGVKGADVLLMCR